LHLSQRRTAHAPLDLHLRPTLFPRERRYGCIGTIFGNYLQGALRNPSAAPGQFANLLLGFALAEATGLFGLVVALIILFVF
jgi:hypothetical protein